MSNRQIIIRKSDDHDDHDHHGGGWKVAYADFMTAMMAFFLMLWIISAADERKLQGLAEFFTPMEASKYLGGQGFLDGQVFGPDGVFSGVEGDNFQDQPPNLGQELPVAPQDGLKDLEPSEAVEHTLASMPEGLNWFDMPAPPATQAMNAASEAAWLGQIEERAERLDAVAQDISQAVNAKLDKAEIEVNWRVERTQDGLLVQILDQEGRPMFVSGSARIPDTTLDLLQIVGIVVASLPYPIVVTGHTDAVPFTSRENYGNWELSADRANAARRALVSVGVSPHQFARVSGVADTVPLNTAIPTAPENRRLTILLEYPMPSREENSGIQDARSGPLQD